MGKKSGLQVASLPLQALLLGFFAISEGALAQTLSVPASLTTLNSSAGEQLLFNSRSRTDYLPLGTQFVTQKNQAYCGVASMVMVLNALGIPAPVAPEFAPYHVFTQDNFFNEKTEKVVTAKVVAQEGMTLDQLGQLLVTYPVSAKVYHAGGISLPQFRTLVIKNLQTPRNFVLVNYLRSSIAQQKGGHISPVAAYSEETDRFLILDVSRYKYPPVWVKAADLWQAMNTIDSVSGKTRGFVLVSTPTLKPTAKQSGS
ncbi:MAG TPA: phytochelatin synthase family protein [Candidatus Caenarcaniphilales bacterium]